MSDFISIFIVRDYLLYFVLPAWNVVGLLDWWCHRRAGIERFGIYEPMLHIALLALAGGPLLLGLFFAINGPILLLMILCFLGHEAVGYADIRWAAGRRGIAPAEQRVHDYLAAIPFAALSLVIVLHWDSLLLLLRHPSVALSQPISVRSPALPAVNVAAILVLVLLCNVLPYIEEFVRAVRHGQTVDFGRG